MVITAERHVQPSRLLFQLPILRLLLFSSTLLSGVALPVCGSDATLPRPSLPSFHCEAYGSLVECKAIDTGNEAIEWAAVYSDKDSHIYRSAGDSFAFRLPSRLHATIEMHLPYADPHIDPLRAVALWRKGRVVFGEWKPTE